MGLGPSESAAEATGGERADGRLEIALRSDSWFLTQNLPIEIRDGRQELIKSIRGDEPSVELAPGLYSVSAILEDGSLHRRHVHIRPGETERVELVAERQTRRRAKGALRGVRGGADETSRGGVVLELFGGAREASRRNRRWILEPDGDLERVPYARLETATEVVEVSLPVNPNGHDGPQRSCELEAWTERNRLEVRVRMAPGRQVASAIERMVETGFMGASAALAKEALQLLLEKYEDPVGAAFGGLLLDRLGRLESQPRWLENLAGSFPWLPDGRILLAALLARSDDGAERRRGLDLLLAAAPQRMMFADGLSLALDLLRRWPDGSRRQERFRVLDEISHAAARAQWQATVLTLRMEPERA